MRRLLFILFFFSGFTALVYEVVWARQLGLVFGNTVYAISAILAIFFAGLALGSYAFGRIADRLKNRLFIYGLLEVGIGIYCFATPFLFSKLAPLQISLWEKLGYLSSFSLSFLVLIIPTVLMGGTFPIIVRVLVRQEKERGEVMGSLYGSNTLGAVLGAFLAGFFLIRFFGVKETIWLAAGVNLLVGVVVLAVSKRWEVGTERFVVAKNQPPKINFRKAKPFIQPTSLRSVPYTLHSNIILLVFALSGFAALALEVLWTRVLILTFGSSTYAFSMILTVFLLGIALGSFLAGKFLAERGGLLFWLAGLEIVLGAAVVFLSPLLGELPLMFLSFYRGEIDFSTNLWAALWLSLLVLFLPTLLMGAIFPLGAKILTANFQKLGQDLGKIYSINTLGGIFGSLAAGFVLLPLLGLQKGILASGFLYLFCGILVISLLSWTRKVKTVVSLVIILFASSALLLPSWNKNILSSGVFVYFPYYLGSRDIKATMERGKLLFYKEGLSATVAVKEEAGERYLRIDGKTDASTFSDLNTEIMAGHLPLLFHKSSKEVLVVGLGSGISLGAIEQHESVENIDMVEIEPAILEAADFFTQANHNALADKRLNVVAGDGRNFLLTSKKNYDVISSEPSNPWVKGNSNLFTKDYYQLAKDHLTEDGVFLHWVQIYNFDPETLKIVLATFHSVFPDMTVWSPLFSNDLLLVGTRKPANLDFALFDKAIQQEKVRQDLLRLSVNDPSQILGFFLFTGEKVKQLVQDIRPHSDNYPFLEFLAPFSLGKETSGQNLEMLLSLQEEPYSFISNLPQGEKEKIEVSLKLKENIFRAKIAMTKHEASKAVTFFEEAWKLDPSRRQIKKELTSLYFDIAEEAFLGRDFARAKKALSGAVEVDQNNVSAHLNLGAIYYQEGNILEAIKEWKMAEAIDPENPDVKKNLELLKKSQ